MLFILNFHLFEVLYAKFEGFAYLISRNCKSSWFSCFHYSIFLMNFIINLFFKTDNFSLPCMVITAILVLRFYENKFSLNNEINGFDFICFLVHYLSFTKVNWHQFSVHPENKWIFNWFFNFVEKKSKRWDDFFVNFFNKFAFKIVIQIYFKLLKFLGLIGSHHADCSVEFFLKLFWNFKAIVYGM